MPFGTFEVSYVNRTFCFQFALRVAIQSIPHAGVLLLHLRSKVRIGRALLPLIFQVPIPAETIAFELLIYFEINRTPEVKETTKDGKKKCQLYVAQRDCAKKALLMSPEVPVYRSCVCLRK